MNLLNKTISNIEKIDYSLSKETQARLDNLTKPTGSLGRLEEFAKQFVEITRIKNPVLNKKVIFTLAGDHGIADESVSAYPKEVTTQMVYNFLNGGAGINVLSKHAGAKVIVADLGVASDFKNADRLKNKKVNYGTKSFLKQPAMTQEEAVKSIEYGIELFEEEYKNGIDIVGIGEMGIGNTTPSSAITAIITGKSVESVTGRGSGINDSSFEKKVKLIKDAIKFHNPKSDDAIDILHKVGGYEIGGMTGIILAAASKRVPIVVDGFISGASLLLAYLLSNKIKDYIFASHCSVESGHKVILDYLGLKPILDLNLRLGEGTGAALAFLIIEAGLKILNEMATFESAGVSNKS